MNIRQITHRDHIGSYILTLDQPTICEVGTRTGDFFSKIYNPNCRLAIIVDIWYATDNPYQNDNNYSQDVLDSQYASVFKKFLPYNNIKIIREFSHKASDFFPDNFFDFIYIDADHSKNGCYQDLVKWYPKVKSGGVISGHDYIAQEKTRIYGHSVEFGVIDAVTKFREENNIGSNRFHLTNEEYTTYLIMKP